MSEVTCGYRLKELEKELVALEGQRAAIQAECEEAPGMPTDGFLADLERAIRGVAEGDATQKLKDLLACIVDEMVVASRPTTACPRFDRCFLRGGGRESNPTCGCRRERIA
jgi:hypothetical protein